jgi:nucleoside 2-deoxyribosyltransferase
MVVDGFKYVGPFFLSDDHSSFHGEGTHGRGIGNEEILSITMPDWKVERKTEIINQCYQWIRKSDVIFVWIDSLDIYGTIAEIGYAKALNKPIFIAIDNRLRDSSVIKDMWFAIHSANKIIYTENHNEAWDVFVGNKESGTVEKSTPSQIAFIEKLSMKAGKTATISLNNISKDTAGKIIAFFKKGKFKEEVSSYFVRVTGEPHKKEAIYKATEVVGIISDIFLFLEDWRFTVPKHTKYVKAFNTKNNPAFSKEYQSGYGGTYYLYTEYWYEHLIETIREEFGITKEQFELENLKMYCNQHGYELLNESELTEEERELLLNFFEEDEPLEEDFRNKYLTYA